MNIAGHVFDFSDGTKIASEHKDELKGLMVMDSNDIEKLADNQFALIMKTANGKIRKYPLCNDMRKLSEVYFDTVKTAMHPSIRKTAERGFSGENNEINIDKLSNHVPVTVAWRQFPLHDGLHIKTAMDRFPHTTERMNPKEKYAYARAIIKEASKHSVPITGKVANYSSETINPVAVKLATSIRMAHLFDDADKDLLKKLAADPSPEKFIEFDKVAGLNRYVRNNDIPDGYESCYTNLKTASVEEDRIRKIPVATIRMLFDGQFADEWERDPITIYKSLPMPTQTMIDKQASFKDVVAATKKVIQSVAPVAAAAATGYVAGEVMAAGKAVDSQFQAKGWAKPKDKSEGLYINNERKVVRQDDKFVVLDANGVKTLEADSLTKLVLMV